MSMFRVLVFAALLSIDALGAVGFLAVHSPFSSAPPQTSMPRSAARIS